MVDNSYDDDQAMREWILRNSGSAPGTPPPAPTDPSAPTAFDKFSNIQTQPAPKLVVDPATGLQTGLLPAPDAPAAMPNPNHVAPAPVAAPTAPLPAVPASPTQSLAATAQKHLAGKPAGLPFTSEDINRLANDPTAYNHFLSSDFQKMNPNQQEAFNAQYEIAKAKRQEKEATGINTGRVDTEKQGIDALQNIHKAEGLQRDAQQHQNEREAEEQRHEAEALEHATQQAAAANEVVRNFHADPNRVINNMGAPQKILGIIALALGIGGGMKTGRNAAVDVLNEAINRDLNAQEKDLEAKKSAGYQDQYLLGQLRKVTGDKQAARKMAQTAYLEQYANTIAEMYDTASTNDQRNKLNILKQQLDAGVQQSHDEVVNHLVGNAETLKAQKQAAAAAAGAKLQAKEDKAREATIKEADEAVKAGTLPPEKYNDFVASRFREHMGVDYQPVARQAPSEERVAAAKNQTGLKGPAFQVAKRADNFLSTTDQMAKELGIDLDKPISTWSLSDWATRAKLALGPDTNRNFKVGLSNALTEGMGMLAAKGVGEAELKDIKEKASSGNVGEELEALRQIRLLAKHNIKSTYEISGKSVPDSMKEIDEEDRE